MIMNKKIIKYGIVIVCIGGLVGLGILSYMLFKPKRNIAATKAEYVLSATQLLTEFTQNEKTANAKYLSMAYGKVILVSGTLAEITEKGDTTLTLSLREPANKEGGISCSMDKTEIAKAKLLKVGDKILVKGECTGYMDITNEVLMVKCLLEK